MLMNQNLQPISDWISFSLIRCFSSYYQTSISQMEVVDLISNDLNSSANYLYTIYQKRWKIEVYHKSIKQNASLATSPIKRVISQSNHIFSSLVAFCKLELLKIETATNHFALKFKLLLKANQAAFLELNNFKKLHLA